LKRRFCRGDYAIARRGAILVENASDLLFQARNKTDYCRNATLFVFICRLCDFQRLNNTDSRPRQTDRQEKIGKAFDIHHSIDYN